MKKKENKNVTLDTGAEIVEVEPLKNNPMISSVIIRIAKGDQVRNGYYLSKEVLEKAAAESLPLTPIVTLFNRFKGDFQGHGEQAILNNSGEYVTTADTEVVGVVPENPTVYWDKEGYLTTIGYLWTERYKELELALEGRPQSMELSLENSILYRKHGVTHIEKTDFVGLCILGKDVPPAYEGAFVHGINFSKKDQERIRKDVDDFMPKLQFALDNNFDESEIHSPVIADVEGAEKDAEIREKVTDAIDILDEVSGNLDPVNQRDLDGAISELVKAETEMKKEPNIIPVTEAARRGLEGQPGYADGIVSTENLNYDTKGATKLVKKREDEELETKEEEVVEQPEEEKEVTETEPVKEGEEVAEKEEEKPSEEEPKPVVAESKPEEAGIETDTKEAQNGNVEAEADKVGEEVKDDPQGKAANSIGQERSSAAAKRTSALLSDISDDELFLYITERLEKTEDVKSRLQSLLGNAIPEQLPENDETPAVPSAIENQKPDDGNETVGVQEPAKEEVKEDGAKEEVAEEKPAESDSEPEKEEVKEEEKEEVVEEKPVEEEDKKKKAQFSDVVEFSVREIVEENARLTQEVADLKEQLSPLLELKYSLEVQDKENMLNEFRISEEGKESIRADFSKLSLEEVEARGALLQYRESKEVLGQNVSSSGIEFSLETDEADPEIEKEDPLEALLKRTKESLQK